MHLHTVCIPIKNVRDITSLNDLFVIVKIIKNNHEALYFPRFPKVCPFRIRPADASLGVNVRL